MFHSIRRHQKWLLAVITTLTIVSFVAWFSPRSQRGIKRGGLFGKGDDSIGSINGRPIAREQYLDAYREAELRYYFSTGDWPQNNEMARQYGIMERETRNRLLLVVNLKEFNIQVTETSVAQWIAEAFQNREHYEGFMKRLPQGVSEADFERFARHEVGIQHLIALTGLSGKLIPPQEAEIVFRRENEQVDTQVVLLQSSNYLAKVTDNPAELMTYYTNRQANYRNPERVQVLYVKFEATNYLAEADQKMAAQTNLNLRIDEEYAQRGANSFKDANNQPLAAEAAKQKIRDEVRHGLALVESRKKAIDFANALIELPAATNNLANLAAAKGFLSKVTEPFAEDGEPPNLKVPDVFVKAAFQLTPAQPIYEQPIVAEDGVYLIGYHKRIPSEVRPLESIRDKVTEDYRKSKVTEMLNAAGKDLYNTLTNSLAQGKTFEAACQEATVTLMDLPPFSQKTPTLPQIPNRGDLTAIKNAAFALAPDKISSFSANQDGGFIVYLQARVPVPDAKVKADLPEFMETLRRTRLREAFGEWLRKEMDMARISLPGDKQSAN